MDFIVDGLATGRMARILSVVDAYTRECLALEADTCLGSGRVTRVLDRLIEERGRPENLRSDSCARLERTPSLVLLFILDASITQSRAETGLTP
jgi:hypothetical protein